MAQSASVPRIERRLAAIMAADVAHYSRLMGVDEVGTLNALKAHRQERIDPVIARHHGRIVKTTGDGLLVEFASVVDAVACAVAIQKAIFAFNVGIHEDRRIVLRIGINVGDIIIDGNDIFGDGVNVAARLEALCEPGGICISRSANDQVRDKLALTFADFGEQTVKNIARAIGVFGLAASDIAALPDDAVPPPDPGPHALNKSSSPLMLVAVLLGVVLLCATGGGWWFLHQRSAITAPVARPIAYSPEDRRLSVIVLPFENSSGDPMQDNLAVNLTRDITNSIARDNTIPIVQFGTAAAYRGKIYDLRTIRRDHNVHFAIEGSARRENGRLILAANVYDTEDGRSVWSGQYNRDDTTASWSEIVSAIHAGFDQGGMDAEIAHAIREHPNDLDKRDLMYAANASSLLPQSREHMQQRIKLTERALALDPNYVWALASSARLLADFVMNGYSIDRDGDLATALRQVDHAVQLSPDDFDAMRQKARVLRAKGDLDQAAALLSTLIERRPQNAYRRYDLAQIQMIQGHPQDALANMLLAKQLAVTGDDKASIDGSLSLALLANDRFGEALSQARLAVTEFTQDSGIAGEIPWLVMIAAQALAGHEGDASVVSH